VGTCRARLDHQSKHKEKVPMKKNLCSLVAVTFVFCFLQSSGLAGAADMDKGMMMESKMPDKGVMMSDKDMMKDSAKMMMDNGKMMMDKGKMMTDKGMQKEGKMMTKDGKMVMEHGEMMMKKCEMMKDGKMMDKKDMPSMTK
jgi:hypothetical protein